MVVIIIFFVGIVISWISHLMLEGHSLCWPINTIVSISGSICGSIIYNYSSLPIHTLWGKLASATIGALASLLPLIAYSEKRKTI